MTDSKNQIIQHRAAALWGVTGVMAIVLFPIVRLSRYVFDALAAGLDTMQWFVLLANVALMAWLEGYRGFQLKFAPRVAARALYLSRTSAPLVTRLAAPLYCIGYFDASRRTKTVAWAGTVAIVILVLAIHRLGQPWRGIIDAGVVVGLSWGLVSMIVMALVTFRSGEYVVSPEVPDRYNDD